MKTKTKIVIAILSSIVLLGLVFFVAYNGEVIQSNDYKQRDGAKKTVLFLTKSMDSAFWQSAYSGANAASTEYNMELICLGPENEDDYETQNEMIEEAIRNKVDAIIFSAIDYEKNAEAITKAAKAGIKIIAVDSQVNSQEVKCYIGTDNYEAGRLAGEEALENHAWKLYIGIVNFAESTKNGQSREEGFRDMVTSDERCEIVSAINVQSSVLSAREGTKEMLKQNPEINVIVTFNEWTSLGVGYAIQDLERKDDIQVIAFDSNEVCVEMLETGEIDSLIVQKPYAMGYLGVEKAYELLQNQKIKETEIVTSSIVVERYNMYSDECQRVLFDFSKE